jgi:hypothetical protein
MRRVIPLLFVLAGVGTLTGQAPVVPNPWTPPVGIPTPTFGVTQTAGAPTHYVDNTHPSTTDTSNPNGTPTRPRRTIPTTLEAGSVVEVRGGPYPQAAATWTWNGTASSPVFIKGVNRPVFQGIETQMYYRGSYFIVDGLVFDDVKFAAREEPHHYAFRNNEIRNWSGSPGGLMAVSGSQDAVILGNHIHHNGDTSGTTEFDMIGVVASTGSLRIWIVDNHIHNIGGDSVRVGTNPVAPEPRAQFLYIGRNEFHDNGENGLDIKQCRDVIVSENLIYNLKDSVSSSGEAIVTHYDAERVWIVNNRIHSALRGVVSTGALGYYVVGNLIWNIHEPNFSSTSMSNGHGIMHRATPNPIVVNNTVWDADHGISQDGNSPAEFVNNIIGNVSASGHHLGWGSTTSASASTVRNILYGSGVRIAWGGTTTYTSIESFMSAQGKGQGSLSADPRFGTGSLMIMPDSPAINAGYATSGGTPHPLFALFELTYPGAGGIARDITGTLRPTAGSQWDIGADEQGGALTMPAPVPPANLRIIR